MKENNESDKVPSENHGRRKEIVWGGGGGGWGVGHNKEIFRPANILRLQKPFSKKWDPTVP